MSKDTTAREYFSKGLTFNEFLATIKSNKDRFLSNYKEMQLTPDDETAFSGLPKRKNTIIRVLAIVEDWCPDVFRHLPILAKIVDTSNDIELRILFRDQNLDLMEQYLTNSCMSIPTIVFFDDDYNELGRWVERPKEATKFMLEVRHRLAQPGMTEQKLRDATRDIIDEEYQRRLKYEMVRELRELLN